MKIKILILILFFSATKIYGTVLNQPLLRHFTMKDGLPSSMVFPMIQDKDGFIWFGTDVGVTRFDGRKFQNFTLADGLSDNYILAVKQDSKGRIWFLGFNGTVSYWLNGKIYNSGSDNLLRKIKSQNSFIDLFEDDQHRLWFISLYSYIIVENDRIFTIDKFMVGSSGIVLNGVNGQIILSPLIPKNGTYINHVISPINFRYEMRNESSYYRLNDGSILFVSTEGLVRQKDTIQSFIMPLANEFKNTRLVDITMTKDSLLWITTMGKGLYCYDLKHPLSKPIIYLENKVTVGVLADKEGNIWISTLNEGLYMIPVFGNKVNIYDKNILKENETYIIGKSVKGELIFGQNNGRMISVNEMGISEIKTPLCDDISNSSKKLLVKDNDIWIASNCGLIHRNLKTGCNHFISYREEDLSIIQISNIKDITFSNNKIYIASGFRICEYPLVCKQASNQLALLITKTQENLRIYSIYNDRSNRLWYGTIEGLASRIEGVEYKHSGEELLLSQRINSIAETEDSTILLGTHGFGLIFYKNNKIILRLTKNDGLNDDICRRVFVHRNIIYIATPSGVSVITYIAGKIPNIKNLNTGNFLPSNDVTDIYVDDKDISIATMEGVAVLGYWAIEKASIEIPELFFNGITVEGNKITNETSNTFSYKNNSFKFNFIGIYYQQPEAVNYRYRLTDNQPWQNSNNMELEFPFLEPGSYQLQIQARIENGTWSEPLFYQFLITPPFWDTYWFLVITISLVLFLIFMILRQRNNKKRKLRQEKEKTEKQIAHLEQQALQTMMNPHFIFNVMNSIQHFINDDNKDLANEYLTDFATLIRLNLNLSYKGTITLEDEINYLELYLRFEKLRVGELLSFEIIVDPLIETEFSYIPVMLIQPLIENAVWHGIMPKDAEGHISIQFIKEDNDLIKVLITDDGVGIGEEFINESSESKQKSHALSMTKQRLKLLGKTSNQNLHIHYKHLHPQSTQFKGTIVELLIAVSNS